jgi:hypothetical protein
MTLYHYTYYSYEEFGRGYIGKRSCKCSPEEDVKYFGSYTDKTFKPTQKIILETYDTAEELAKAEEILHAFYDVTPNPHFANKHNAGEKFFYVMTSEEAKENGKKGAKIVVDLGLGIHGLSKEERSEAGKKGAKACKELGVGINALTSEQLSLHGKKGGKVRKQQLIEEDFYSTEKQSNRGKKGGRKIVDLGLGIHGLSKEERSEAGKKGGQTNKKNKSGICGLTKEQRSENARILALQKWQCTVTGFISTVQGIARYQRARGIDTSNRVRLS